MKIKQKNEIMLEAAEAAYLFEANETLEDPFRVNYLIQGAINRINHAESDGMSEEEAYDLYYRLITSFVESIL